MFSFFLTTWGWFAWLSFLDGVYAPSPSGTYAIRNSFTELYGKDVIWWATIFIVLGLMGMLEMIIRMSKRVLVTFNLWKWPPWSKSRSSRDNIEEWDLELWQELEQDPAMRARLRRLCRDDAGADEEDEDDIDVQMEVDMARGR